MKLTNKVLQESWPYLNALASVQLSPTPGFRIGRIVRQVKDVVIDIEAQRAKLVEKFGEKDGDGKLKTTVVDGVESTKIADIAGYKSGMDELLAIETEIEIDPITLKDLGDVQLAPNLFAHLDWLIVE